jgi:hypothetical protein
LEAARLAAEVRNAVTVVIGFLELIAEEPEGVPDARRQQWWARIELRLDELVRLVREIQARGNIWSGR